jgi:hypothetical protein
MSFSAESRYLQVHRSLVHPLVAIFVPLLFLLGADQILRILLPLISFFPRFIAPLLLTTAIEEAIVGNLLFRERASLIARFRELCLVLAAAFSGLFILHAAFSGWSFAVSPDLIYPMALVALQWLFSAGVHSSLRQREILFSAVAGQRGGALRHKLRDSSYQAGLTMQRVGRVKMLVVFFQVFIFALLITATLLGRKLTLAGAGIIVCHTLGGLLVIGMLHHFIDEQLLLGAGIPASLRFETRRFLHCLALALLAAAVVALAARDVSLLPLSALIAALRKIDSLLHFGGAPLLSDTLQRALIARQRSYVSLMRQQPPSFGPLVFIIAELLRRLFITLLGTGLFLFIVSPLFSEDFVARLRALKPFRSLARKLGRFLGFCILLLQRLARRLRLLRSDPLLTVEQNAQPAHRKPGRSGSSARPSLRKKLQMGRVLRSFLSLIRWGESLGIPYFSFNTPQEYTGRLSAAVPACTTKLAFVVDVFEEAVFSAHLVGGGKLSRYQRTIRSLRRIKRREEQAAAGTG